MRIRLPADFSKKLESSSREIGITTTAIAGFEDWFSVSQTPFFRDYTDHSGEHITNVLATAAGMIPPEAEPIVSAQDVTILVLATLLHDAAMHLTAPGFEQIIRGEARDRRIDRIDTKPWPDLWDEYLFDARRWDDTRIRAVFGEAYLQSAYSASDPFDRWDDLRESDFRLIGEFVRRHHGRLAHEFAVFGVPGNQPVVLSLPAETPKAWRDLSGLVARSHGLPLRPCLDYASAYHLRDYNQIHIAYLMALLRLSDYLQMSPNRANPAAFKFRVIPSLSSMLEWEAHKAIQNITPEHQDPESVEVQANPGDAATFLRVREWLNGIQAELDSSWAVLGEFYGRFPNLRGLGLHWRRIRSNLDDISTFESTVAYVPRRIRIEVARAELLSLLIKPLYGDEPSFGVRELVQNAVDAVRERKYFQRGGDSDAHVFGREQDDDVVVRLSDLNEESDSATLEVIDTGIGMSEFVLTEYFLTAGASFRQSELWQRVFERSDLPPDKTRPRSQIARSGRFGVGALAAFLLGDEIYVETRHVSADAGLKLNIDLSSEAIHVERDTSLPFGTYVRVELSRSQFEALTADRKNKRGTVHRPPAWDWYIQNYPSVGRYYVVGDSEYKLEKSVELDLSRWHEAEIQLPLRVHWHGGASRGMPALSCNGIYVSNSRTLPLITAQHCDDEELTVSTPSIHVTDPDGHLPLGLTRKELVSDEYGFEPELAASIMRDYIARIITHFPETADVSQIRPLIEQSPVIDSPAMGVHYMNAVLPNVLLSADGFAIASTDALQALARPVAHVLWLGESFGGGQLPPVDSWDCVMLMLKRRARRYGAKTESTIADVLTDLGIGVHEALEAYEYTENSHRVQKTIKLESDQNIDKVIRSYESTLGVSAQNGAFEQVAQYPIYSGHSEKIELVASRLRVYSEGAPSSSFPFEDYVAQHVGNLSGYRTSRIHIPLVADLHLCGSWTTCPYPQLVHRWWSRFVPTQWVPWDRSKRSTSLANFAELEPYLRWQEDTESI
jgi:hypothetical protein